MTQEDAGLKAWLGRHVELECRYADGEVERLSLDIVADPQADFEHGLLGEGTPLARAIYGRRAGETASYLAGGEPVRVKILAVRGEQRDAAGDPAAERAERVRKGTEERDLLNAILFASSTDTKWGEYDPDALITGDDDHKEEG